MRSSSRRRFVGLSIGSAAACATLGAARPDSGEETAIVVDAHTHFYDTTRSGGVTWPRREDALLHRPVLPNEWARLARPEGVTATIVIEASRRIEDNQWLLDLCAADRPPAGMQGLLGVIGNLPLGDPSFAALLDRFAANRHFLGIRTGAATLGRVGDDPAVAADLSRVVKLGLAVDVLGAGVAEAVVRAADRFPSLRIVVDHMAGPAITADGPEESWRRSIAQLADHPNVFLKVSGLMESAARNPAGEIPRDPKTYAAWLDVVWEAFGERRLLFGSNWPVSLRGGSYAEVVRIVKWYASHRGGAAERWLFCEAARAAYRW